MVEVPDLQTVFVIQLISSFIMVGITLVSQFVTYPTYSYLAGEQLKSYESQYLVKTLIIYGPIMLLEMLTAIRLTMKIRNFDLHSTFRANLIIVGIIWGITFFFELPSHFVLLTNGYNSLVYQTLLLVNFTRLILWIIKCRALVKITPHMFKGEEIFYQEFL